MPKNMSGGNTVLSTRGSKQDEEQDSGALLVSNMHKIGLTTDATANLRLLLASQSPRRQEILDMMGLAGRYIAEPSPLNEQELQMELMTKKVSPMDYARTLAERKAHAMCEKMVKKNGEHHHSVADGELTLVIGSDTIVDLDGSIMEKPTDEADAFSMLQRLSGNWHQVHTGVAIYGCGTGQNIQLMFSFTDTARVKFATLADQDIRSYIASNEPMDKAGSYGIQGRGGQLVERIDGDFFTVMGLPMHRLSKELSRAITSLGF